MLYYPIVKTEPLIGTKDSAGNLTEIELESTYQTESATEATKTFETGSFFKLALAVSYTMGASETSNSIEIRVEESPDRINFYNLVNDSTSGGTSTLTSREFTYVGVDGANDKFSIPLDISYKNLRVSVKETGVAANKGSVYVEATLSGM